MNMRQAYRAKLTGFLDEQIGEMSRAGHVARKQVFVGHGKHKGKAWDELTEQEAFSLAAYWVDNPPSYPSVYLASFFSELRDILSPPRKNRSKKKWRKKKPRVAYVGVPTRDAHETPTTPAPGDDCPFEANVTQSLYDRSERIRESQAAQRPLQKN